MRLRSEFANIFKGGSLFLAIYTTTSSGIMDSFGSCQWDACFDQLFFGANPGVSPSFFSIQPPTIPSYNPSLNIASSWDQVGPNLDTYPLLTPIISSPKRDCEASTFNTDLFFQNLDLNPVRLILDANTLQIKTRLPVPWHGIDHQPPVATNHPVFTSPKPTAPKAEGLEFKHSKSRRRKGTRGAYSNAKQRKRILDEDIYVLEVQEKENCVVCAGCETRIHLDKRGCLYLQNWNTHRGRCKGVKDQIVSCLTHFR